MEQEENKDAFKVVWKRKIEKDIAKMPDKMQKRFHDLVADIRKSGPIRTNWANFSSLGKNLYHCHIGYSWVVCWRREEDTIVVEVYYVGSRESAPY